MNPEPGRPAPEPLTVIMCLHDLGRIAEGATITSSTPDGETSIRVRLASVDEYLATVERGHRWFEDHNLDHPAMPSRDTVASLVRPIGGHS